MSYVRPAWYRHVRYWCAGVYEHRRSRPNSGATDHELMDAYWAGYHFAYRVRRFIRGA